MLQAIRASVSSAPEAVPDRFPYSRRKSWALVGIFAAATVLVAAYLKRRASEFAVTNKRVLVKVGLFHTRSMELLLSKVEGITVDQDLVGKLLNCGSIVVTGSGGTREEFTGIGEPLEFRRALQQAAAGGPYPAR